MASRSVRERKATAGFVFAVLLGSVAAACGSSQEGSTFVNPGPDGSSAGSAGGNPGGGFDNDGGGDGALDPDAYFFKDPPPKWCGPDGGADGGGVIVPGGTPDCPDDKNRTGCSCPREGMQAPCWPGPRSTRNLGVCKDGVTTCLRSGELSQAWGPCVGAVLPVPGVTKGREACKCFSQGEWRIDNVIPFYVETNIGGTASQFAESSYVTGRDDAGVAQVMGRTTGVDANGNIIQSHHPFSTDSLKVDCEGRFNLCFVIKVGDWKNPKATDCAIMDPVCTGEFDYPQKAVVKQLPDLAEWMSNNPAQRECARQFKLKAGYAELAVKGQSYLCEPVDDGSGNQYVFQRFPYCPLTCNQTPNAPECQGCTNGASGQF